MLKVVFYGGRLKEIGRRLQVLITTLYSIVNTIGRIYVSNEEINKHVLPITITKVEEVQFSMSS